MGSFMTRSVLICSASPHLEGWGFAGLCGLMRILDYDFNMIYMMTMIEQILIMAII